MLEVEGLVLVVVAVVLGVVGEVVQVVTTAEVASPYPEGARSRRKNAKSFFSVARGGAGPC